jgi:hypothetical protein
VRGGNPLHPCRLEPSVGAESQERNRYFFRFGTRRCADGSCIARLPAMRKKKEKPIRERKTCGIPLKKKNVRYKLDMRPFRSFESSRMTKHDD